VNGSSFFLTTEKGKKHFDNQNHFYQNTQKNKMYRVIFFDHLMFFFCIYNFIIGSSNFFNYILIKMPIFFGSSAEFIY